MQRRTPCPLPPYLQVQLVRGGVEASADLVRVAIEPSIGMALKSGFDIASKVDIVRLPTDLCVDAFVDVFFSKSCGNCPFCVPCGVGWQRYQTWAIGCYSSGGSRHTVLERGSGGGVLTPPPIGVVSVDSRAGTARAACSK